VAVGKRRSGEGYKCTDRFGIEEKNKPIALYFFSF
jgi:hypothetical protein